MKIYYRIHKFCLYMYVCIKIISLNNYLKISARKNFFFGIVVLSSTMCNIRLHIREEYLS